MGRMKESGMDAQQRQSLEGKDFRAVVRISNLVDDTTADVGETCERVPQADLADLVRGGYIVPVIKGDADGSQE